MIAGLEVAIGREAIIKRLPEQPGDVPQTWADVSKAKRLLGYEPQNVVSARCRKVLPLAGRDGDPQTRGAFSNSLQRDPVHPGRRESPELIS